MLVVGHTRTTDRNFWIFRITGRNLAHTVVTAMIWGMYERSFGGRILLGQTEIGTINDALLRQSSNHKGFRSNNETRHKSQLGEIKLIITYMESACIFYAQILTPTTHSTLRMLNDELIRVCPKSTRGPMIRRTSLYATLYIKQWSRCLTRGVADAEGNVKVQFIDYGNEMTVHCSELVLLPQKNEILSSPYLAYPFKFPGMASIPDHREEALAKYDVNTVYSGIVACDPQVHRHTDIVLLRNITSGMEMPCKTSFNSYMIALQYAKEVEDPYYCKPQACFIVKSLLKFNDDFRVQRNTYEERIQEMEEKLLKQRQLLNEIGLSDPTALDEIRSLDKQKDEFAVIESQRIPHPFFPAKAQPAPTAGNLEAVIPREKSICGLVMEAPPTKTEVTSAAVQTDSEESSMELSIQQSIDNLLRQISGVCKNAGLSEEVIAPLAHASALVNIKEHILDSPMIEVETAISRLHEAVGAVAECKDHSKITEYLAERDNQLQTVIENIENFLLVEEDDNTQDLKPIENIVSNLKSMGVVPLQAPYKDTLSSLTELIGSFEEKKSYLLEACGSQIALLADQFTLLSNTLSSYQGFGCSGDVNIKEKEDLKPVHSIGQTLQQLLRGLHNVLLERSQTLNLIEPLATKIQPGLLFEAEQCLSVNVKREDIKRRYIATLVEAKQASEYVDISTLEKVRDEIKAAKRSLQLALIDEEDTQQIKDAMTVLHRSYQREIEEKTKLSTMISGLRPELASLVPHLKGEEGLIMPTWDISDFVLPNEESILGPENQIIHVGQYLGETVFFVEYDLLTAESLECQAISNIVGKLEDCFAILINRKWRKALGATKVSPI